MRHLSLVLALAVPSFAAAQPAKPLSPEQAKTAFLKQLDRPKVAANISPARTETKGGLAYSRWSFVSEKKADGTAERVPVLVVSPAGAAGKRPAIVVLHGTGGNKDGVASWLEEFARQGVVGVAIDARYHGDRSGGAKGSAAYVAAITKAWRTPAGKPTEHPFYYDTVWDLWRLVDVLSDRPDIDPARLGMLGISMGGIQTWLAASVDDRVKVAAPLIAVQSFRWSLENDEWAGRANTIKATHEAAAKDLGEPAVNQKVCRALWNKIIPGILDDYDCPNLLPLFASRALFISNGDRDPNCPIGGAKLAIKRAEEAFAKAGAKERLEVHVGVGVGHDIPGEHHQAAVTFCVKWLTK